MFECKSTVILVPLPVHEILLQQHKLNPTDHSEGALRARMLVESSRTYSINQQALSVEGPTLSIRLVTDFRRCSW